MTNVRETRRADELKPGDWLADDESGNANPNEVMAVFQYPTARGNRVHLTTRVPGLDPCSCGNLAPDAEFELITKDELAALREQAERAQKIADIRALADWLEANPWLPVADLDVNRHLYGPDGYRTVVETAKRLGAKLDTHLDDRTKFTYRRGTLTYSVLAWHDGGRPADPAPEPLVHFAIKGRPSKCGLSADAVADTRTIHPIDVTCQECRDAAHFVPREEQLEARRVLGLEESAEHGADPTGLAYTRADDEPDDPTPVSGARVPAHTGGVTEGGLVDETPPGPVHMAYADGGAVCGESGAQCFLWTDVTCARCIDSAVVSATA